MIYIKFLFAAIAAFVSYNIWQHFHNNTQFDAIYGRQQKAEVVQHLGAPFNVYICGDRAQSPYNSQNLCSVGVAEVDAFETCGVPFICPGWNAIAFSAAGEAISKLRFKPGFAVSNVP